jgi:hypothetical protein
VRVLATAVSVAQPFLHGANTPQYISHVSPDDDFSVPKHAASEIITFTCVTENLSIFQQ